MGVIFYRYPFMSNHRSITFDQIKYMYFVKIVIRCQARCILYLRGTGLYNPKKLQKMTEDGH